jgi:hypothetical protein
MTDPAGPTVSADPPPHLATEEKLAPMVPRPIEVSPVHFRAHGRCYAAFVVDVISDSPLSPEFKVDVAVLAPRDSTRKKDRFVNHNTLPGTLRWANNLTHAMPDPQTGEWQETTWHYPGRHCLPEIVLRGITDAQ